MDDIEDLGGRVRSTVIASKKSPYSATHEESYHEWNPTEIDSIRSKLLTWYDSAKRILPWRKEISAEVEGERPQKRQKLSTDARAQRAYEVWVSEIMLQQTQVSTVIDYYNKWMLKWPTIFDLADANLEEINEVWAGLGYYSRAQRLHEGAKYIVEKFNGKIPEDPTVLEKEVKGIGRYTAGAVTSIAYGKVSELVDGNVIRVFSRMRGIGGDPKHKLVVELHWSLAKRIVSPSRPGDFNQSLMELGATVCTPANPDCGNCPVKNHCIAYIETGVTTSRIQTEIEDLTTTEACSICATYEGGEPVDPPAKEAVGVAKYPRKPKKKKAKEQECNVYIVQISSAEEAEAANPKYMICQRPKTGLLANLWEFPTIVQDDTNEGNNEIENEEVHSRNCKSKNVQSGSEQTLLAELLGIPHISDLLEERIDLGRIVHLFTHIRQTMHVECYKLNVKTFIDINLSSERCPTRLVTQEEFWEAAVSTGMKKAMKLLEKVENGAKDEKKISKKGTKRKKPNAADKSQHRDISSFFIKNI
ncbi:DNA glycosylase [Paraphysoderma sedebokerense]|nr:DNA glycosylase [Paraphysoderma sedebokerense]